MMEIERLKVLKEEEERDIRKHEARKKGAQVIVDQIQERTIQRMKEQEVRDKEKEELHANIERMRQEDVAITVAKKSRINDLMKQAAEANAQSLIEK
jgi:Na+/phosphate symporter